MKPKLALFALGLLAAFFYLEIYFLVKVVFDALGIR
jgi:hypothetical protein